MNLTNKSKIELQHSNLDLIITATHNQLAIELLDYQSSSRHGSTHSIHELDIEGRITFQDVAEQLRQADKLGSQAKVYDYGTIINGVYAIEEGPALVLYMKVMDNQSMEEEGRVEFRAELRGLGRLSNREVEQKEHRKNIARLQYALRSFESRLGLLQVNHRAQAQKEIKLKQINEENSNKKIEQTFQDLRKTFNQRVDQLSLHLEKSIEKVMQENRIIQQQISLTLTNNNENLNEKIIASQKHFNQIIQKGKQKATSYLQDLTIQIRKLDSLCFQIADHLPKPNYLNLVQKSSPFLKYFSISRNSITRSYCPYEQWYQLLFTQRIPRRDIYTFWIRIVRSPACQIVIGIVKSTRLQCQYSAGSGEAVGYYGSTGNKWPGNVGEGAGFGEGELVAVRVDREKGAAEWSVEGEVRARHWAGLLAEEGDFVPYVEMGTAGDIVEWLGSKVG